MKAKEYIFILGRYPELSKLEIFALLRKLEIKSEIIFESDTVLVLKTQIEINVSELNKVLGGTVKIGELVRSFPQSVHEDELEEYFTSASIFEEIFINPPTKLVFGISLYPYARQHDKTNNLARFQRKLIHLLKDHLDQQGFKTRYPHLDGTFLSSASVDKNKILTSGAEILLIETPTQLYIGKTLTVQEFESFSKRDYGRPKRDMESGIMPPKIARMMINIAEIEKEETLLDPFCGSGTLIQEALLLGYKKVIGTDLSQKAIHDTKENIIWLRKNSDVTTTPQILQHDVTKLAEKLQPRSVDAIVTEPYMGPNLKNKPHLKDVQKTKAELEDLYLNAFKSFAQVLKPGGSIVMIFPVFHVHHHYLMIDLLDKIARLGFSQVVLSHEKRNSLLLGNSQDYVLREIIKWKREDYE